MDMYTSITFYSFSKVFILHTLQILCSLVLVSNLPNSIFILNTHIRLNSHLRNLNIYKYHLANVFCMC